MQKTIVALLLLASPALAFAGNGGVVFDGTNRVPEPETLALVAGAFVAIGIVRWIHRK